MGYRGTNEPTGFVLCPQPPHFANDFDPPLTHFAHVLGPPTSSGSDSVAEVLVVVVDEPP